MPDPVPPGAAGSGVESPPGADPTRRVRRRPGGRLRRGDRMVVLAQRLMNEPGRLHSLSAFADELGAAKSTISEDLSLLRLVVERFGMGRVETVAGAAGGVRYRPVRTPRQIQQLV